MKPSRAEILAPRPMTREQIADLVKRTREAQLGETSRGTWQPAGTTARERFKIGDRVRQADAYFTHAKASMRFGRRYGEVTGFTHSPPVVRVCIYGRTNSGSWHMDFWELDVAS